MSVRVKYNGKSFNLEHTIIEEVKYRDGGIDYYIIHHLNGTETIVDDRCDDGYDIIVKYHKYGHI